MLIAVWLFIFGLLCGSFANAVIWRIKTGKSFLRGRSICPACGHQLAAVDLIPVVSWLVLRARCRDCQAKISPQYPAVELLTGIIFAASWLALMPQTLAQWLDFIFWLYIVLVLVILAVYDLRWMIIPDKVLLPAIFIAAVRLPVLLLLGEPLSVVRGPMIAAVLAGGAFYALAAVSKGKWMGGGDIKLVFLLGLVLGIQYTATALFLATTVAAIIGGGLLLSGHLKSRYIAFGPFLSAMAIVSMLYGQRLIDFYLEISGLGAIYGF